jgi:hypothetical protein
MTLDTMKEMLVILQRTTDNMRKSIIEIESNPETLKRFTEATSNETNELEQNK